MIKNKNMNNNNNNNIPNYKILNYKKKIEF